MTTGHRSAPIVVIGATGQQGGAVVDALLSRGAAVRAAVRDPNTPKARTLADRGVELTTADLDSTDSLQTLFSGATAAYAMTTFTGPTGVEGEVEHGRIIARAAEEAALPFLVYSSVGGAERHSSVPHFESKHRVENFIRDAVPAAFVRPTFFMENLPSMVQRIGGETVLAAPLPDDVPLQMVSVATIGRVAAAFLRKPPPSGTAVEIAGDELTGSQMAQRISSRGVAVRYRAMPLTALDGDADLQAMYRWLSRTPSYRADFERTRALSAPVENLTDWLRSHQLS